MKQFNTVKIGVIGCGTVGTTFIEAFRAKRSFFRTVTGVDFVITRITDKDSAKKRLFPDLFVPSAEEIIADPEINIVVELVGGTGAAFSFITGAMQQGKSVVTANKALLSERADELFALAAKKRVSLGFETSVAGAIPIIKTLRESFIGNNLTLFLGILNGTTNFILSRMSDEGMGFSEALAEARRRGYAEADPHLDISGYDTAHKLAILARFIFRKSVSLKEMHIEGIQQIEPADIRNAAELGYRIKLLAVGKKKGHTVELRVHPALLPSEHQLARVEDVFNGIYLEGDLIGKSLLFGEGAGGPAAASSVISDIVEIGLKLHRNDGPALHFPPDPQARLLPPDEVETRYYFRFSVLDRPAVLGEIARVLGENSISIASVIQKKESPRKTVPVVMLTHRTKERNVKRALRIIDGLPVIKNRTVKIRVED